MLQAFSDGLVTESILVEEEFIVVKIAGNLPGGAGQSHVPLSLRISVRAASFSGQRGDASSGPGAPAVSPTPGGAQKRTPGLAEAKPGVPYENAGSDLLSR